MTIAQSGFIDVHHHVVPPWYREAVTQNYPDLYMHLPTWSVESDGELMERQGIATAILSLSDPGVFFGDQALATKLARRYNEFVAELITQFPRQYGAFGVLPLPNIQAATEEVIYALDTLKLDGIGLLSNYRGFYLSDEGADDLFNSLNRRHAVVFLHPAEPPAGTSPQRAIPALFDYPFETTRAITLLLTTGKLERYPEIRWILAHAGGTLPYLAYRISSMFGAIRNMQASTPFPHAEQDVLTVIQSLYYDTAISGSALPLPTLQAVAEPSHILFGSDATFAPEAGITANTQGLLAYPGFQLDKQFMIGSGNARALFPRLRTL